MPGVRRRVRARGRRAGEDAEVLSGVFAGAGRGFGAGVEGGVQGAVQRVAAGRVRSEAGGGVNHLAARFRRREIEAAQTRLLAEILRDTDVVPVKANPRAAGGDVGARQ